MKVVDSTARVVEPAPPRPVIPNKRTLSGNQTPNKRTNPAINEQASAAKPKRGRPRKWATDAERMQAKRDKNGAL